MTWHLPSGVSASADNAGPSPRSSPVRHTWPPAATRNALDAGATGVVLFTDLANPSSNALYPRPGYRPIEDRAVVEFPR